MVKVFVSDSRTANFWRSGIDGDDCELDLPVIPRVGEMLHYRRHLFSGEEIYSGVVQQVSYEMDENKNYPMRVAITVTGE